MSYFLLPFLCLLLLVGCSTVSSPTGEARRPSSQSTMGELVTASEAIGFCADEDSEKNCLATWTKAKEYCERNGGHLPSALEYVSYLTAFGIKMLTPSEFKKTPGVVELSPLDIKGLPRRDGYYKVACQPNPDGTDDTFYMNDYHYFRPANLVGNHRIWTATSPPTHDEAAHVVYDEWGGGGGLPSEHLKNAANAFRCAH